jgi:hypothetical protein
VAFGAYGLFARVAFGDAYHPVAVFTVKLNYRRFGWYPDSFAALWAFSQSADVLVLDPDFMSTVFAIKPNHKALLLLGAVMATQP